MLSPGAEFLKPCVEFSQLFNSRYKAFQLQIQSPYSRYNDPWSRYKALQVHVLSYSSPGIDFLRPVQSSLGQGMKLFQVRMPSSKRTGTKLFQTRYIEKLYFYLGSNLLKPYVLMSRLSLEVIISMNRALHDLFLLF
jgi:hypothetical protein